MRSYHLLFPPALGWEKKQGSLFILHWIQSHSATPPFDWLDKKKKQAVINSILFAISFYYSTVCR